MVSYKEFSETAKKKGMSQNQIDAGWGNLKNNASVGTGAVAGMSAQPQTTSVSSSNNNMSVGGMSFASDYTKSLLNGGNGYSSPASDYSKDLLSGNVSTNKTTSTSSTKSTTSTGSTKKNSGLTTKSTNNNVNPNAVYDNNGNYLGSKDIVGGGSNNTKSDYQKRLDILNSVKGKISEEEYNKTLQEINAKFGGGNNGLLGGDDNGDILPSGDIESGLTGGDMSESKAGFYNDGTGEYSILGYDELSPDMQKYVDQMSDADRKYISNMWAAGMQEQVKTYLNAMRQKEQAEVIQGKKQDLYNTQREASLIQAEQNLRHSKEQVENLKQNWEYLGNMGMPGLSKTKLDAVSDSIKEAETTLGEIKRLQDLSLDAQAKEWDIDVTQYSQQIDNLMYNLNWQVSQEIQNALNKYTTAELEGQLDTIDGVTAFKRSLLEDLDNNISGITTGSLEQMKYITDSYMQMADKAYEEAKLYKDNMNVVNSEMSAIRGYYVDGNGNAILDSQGLPIKVSQSAPIAPVFDKESGKLIQFGYDENGNIVADVTQVYDGDQSSIQATIVSLLENGVSTQDILKYVPGADLKTVQELAKVVNTTTRSDGLPLTYNGKSYNVASQESIDKALATLNKGGWGGQCGYFVNNYLEDIGVGRLYTDPITDKTKNINSTEAKVGNVVVMDSPTKPEYGHVGIITAIDDNGNMTILQSNRNGNEQIYTTTKNINDGDIYGFFDPRKSIEEYNNEGKSMTSGGGVSEGGYDKNYVADYNTYWTKGINSFTKATQDQIIEIFGSMQNFVANANAYKAEVDKQVGEVAKDMMSNLYDVYMWLTDNGTSEPSFAKMQELRLGVRGTKGREMKKKVENILSSMSLQKLISLKKEGATFGALSDKELGFITDAATWLDMSVNRDAFVGELKRKVNEMANYYGITDISQLRSEEGGIIGNNGGTESVGSRKI